MTPIVPVLGISLWLIAKIFVLFGLALYFIFTLVMIKQVKLMTETLIIGISSFVKLLTYLHLAFAVLVFILALALL
jgi:hypothetical protein